MALAPACVWVCARSRALEIAALIAKSAPLSLRMAKAAVNHGLEVDLSTGLHMVRHIQCACAADLAVWGVERFGGGAPGCTRWAREKAA